MQKSFILATVSIGSVYAVAIIARFAGFTSFDIPTIISGGFVCGLVLMAFSDYSRKPRFRFHQAAQRATSTSPSGDTVSGWTYTTVSA